MTGELSGRLSVKTFLEEPLSEGLSSGANAPLWEPFTWLGDGSVAILPGPLAVSGTLADTLGTLADTCGSSAIFLGSSANTLGTLAISLALPWNSASTGFLTTLRGICLGGLAAWGPPSQPNNGLLFSLEKEMDGSLEGGECHPWRSIPWRRA